MKALVARSCPTLCDPMDCSPPDSSVHGILQARILEWVVVCFSRDLPDPGIEPWSPALQVDSSPSEPSGKPETRRMPSYLLISHGSWYECWGRGIKRDGQGNPRKLACMETIKHSDTKEITDAYKILNAFLQWPFSHQKNIPNNPLWLASVQINVG